MQNMPKACFGRMRMRTNSRGSDCRKLPVPDFLQRKLCQTKVASKRKNKNKKAKTKTRMSSGEVRRACRLYCSPGRKGGGSIHIGGCLQPLIPCRLLESLSPLKGTRVAKSAPSPSGVARSGALHGPRGPVDRFKIRYFQTSRNMS